MRGVAGDLRAAARARAAAGAARSRSTAFARRCGGWRRTWREAREYRDFAWLLACAACYQAGISVVIALAAVYAEQALGFKQAETMLLVFLVNIAAALGAFGFGYCQDRIGHKRALGVTLVGWIVMTVLAVMATGPGLFWVAAVVAGLCMGSSQSRGAGVGRAVRAGGATGRVLRAVDLRDTAGGHRRSDHLRPRHRADRGQPPHRDPDDRRVLRDRPAAAWRAWTRVAVKWRRLRLWAESRPDSRY